jgi:hypothetical protein
MGQSHFSESNSRSASQKSARILWNPKIHYRVHNSPMLVSVLRQMHRVHNFLPCFPKIHSNVIFPYTPRASLQIFRQKVCMRFYISYAYYVIAQLILLNLITLTIYGESFTIRIFSL